MKKVCVLLASYNGEKYIEEQLNSIVMQVDIDVTIYVSLDVSIDNTLSIVKNFSSNNERVVLLEYGDKFGSAGSNFFHLIRSVNVDEYDYVAFSDQDDIWPERKLYEAVTQLQDYDCYSANVTAFWDCGREELINKAQQQRKWDYLFEAAGPGCTYVLRRDIVLAFKSWLIERYGQMTHDIALHDWLIYAFCRHFGYRWFIDPRPMMRYRQHANNQVGTNNSINAAKKRLLLIKRKWYRRQVTKIAEHLALQNTPIAKYGLNKGYIGNLYLLFNVNQLRRRLRDRIALSFALLFNIF